MMDQLEPVATPLLEVLIDEALSMRIFGGRELSLRQRLEIAKHLNTVLSGHGYGSQHDAYEKGFALGFDKAADDIGAWQVILDYEEDTSDNPYIATPIPTGDVR